MAFVQSAPPNVLRFPVERRGDELRHTLPRPIRTALIVGSAVALWAVVLLAAHYLVAALV